MQVKLFTDYAIRIVLYVAECNDIVPSIEISRKLNIPQSIVLKIGNKLKHSGILAPLAGIQGGLRLKKRPEDITLMDIVVQFENSTKLSKCLDEKHADKYGENNRAVRRFYEDLQMTFDEKFRDTTIGTLLEA